MCGIVKGTKDILLKGLERFEHRGFDSAGIALINAREKGEGKVKGLRKG